MSYLEKKMYNKSLSQMLSKYENPEATKREINEVTQMYKGLIVKQEPFNFSDGTRMDLVHLVGTIPISFKGAHYNIPICIWLMDTHPNNAPMCYLKPTPNMKIKISRHVDHHGKIYMPYLHDWSPSSSDLIALIQVLIMHFSEEPPLYQVDVLSTNVTPYPTNSYMPMPGAVGGTPYPRYPPYPVQSHGVEYPQQPYPSYPYPKTTPYPSYPVYPAAASSVSDSTPSSSTGTITEQHIRASLLSAVQEKVKRRLDEQYSQTQAELETLDRIQQDLTQGKNRLDHLISKLDSELAECEKNISILKDKDLELDMSLTKLSDQGEIDVDEAVTTTAPLYKQLLDAFAEEAAIEDAIYYLGEALRRGVIDLDVFLKHVRGLSHKQFMLRALMQKCRAKAGLAG